MRELPRAFVLVCLLLGAHAAAGADGAAEYLDASARFEALVSQSTREGRMPRLAEKEAAEVISTLSDTGRFLDSVTFRLDDLGALMDICAKANAAVMSYALFELKGKIDPKADSNVVIARLQALMAQNIRTFQDELSRLQPFVIRCMARTVPLLNEFMSSLPPEEMTEIRRAGLQRARAGTAQTYASVLLSVAGSDLGDNYRQRLLESLAETAAVFGSSLQLPVRRQLLDLVNAVKPASPDRFHPHLAKIADAMGDPRCEGLCAF